MDQAAHACLSLLNTRPTEKRRGEERGRETAERERDTEKRRRKGERENEEERREGDREEERQGERKGERYREERGKVGKRRREGDRERREKESHFANMKEKANIAFDSVPIGFGGEKGKQTQIDLAVTVNVAPRQSVVGKRSSVTSR